MSMKLSWSIANVMFLICCGLLQPVAWSSETDQKPGNNGSETSIQLLLDDANLEQFAYKYAKPDIIERISNNLAEWHYPVKEADRYTHTLTVSLGKIDHLSTPVGVSFSSGNSDPRSVDFQKAEVLPVNCRLTVTGNASSATEHQTTFSANPFIEKNRSEYVLEKLVNDISTACLSVLEDQKMSVVADRPDSKTFRPSWFPDVQVEVKQIPATGVSELNKDAESTASPNTNSTTSESTTSPNTNSTTTEVKTQSEGRKQLIIHNQGSPLILEMGHERR